MKLLLTVFIGIFIGWITNYIAIKLLFRPYKEINFLFFKIQGLIPKRKNEIGKGIAEIVEKELISVKDFTSCIDKNAFSENLGEFVDKILEKKLKEKIKETFPFIKMFLTDSVVSEIKNAIKNLILENSEEIILFFTNHLEDKLSLSDMIEEKISNFSLEKVEEIIMKLSKKELKHIELVGAILGGIIGIFQYFIFILL